MKRNAQDSQKAIDESWSINYSARERDSSKDIRCVQMSWENRTPEEILENLNAFLVSINSPLRVVPEVEARM